MRTKKFIISLALLIPNLACGNGFELFGRQDDLKMTVVVDVGEAEAISAPFGNRSARDFIRINGRCFEPIASIGSWGYRKKAAFVVVDQSKNLKIATLENGINSVKVDVIPVVHIECSSSASGDLRNDPEKLIEDLKRKQEEVQGELDRLKRRK